MTTARENILAAVATIAGGLANVVAYRSREAPVSRNEGSTILVHPEEESADLMANGLTMRDLVVVCSIITRGQFPDKIADTVAQGLHAALYVDQTLGGLAARVIELGSKWEFKEANQTALVLELRYKVRYLTPATSLAALA